MRIITGTEAALEILTEIVEYLYIEGTSSTRMASDMGIERKIESLREMLNMGESPYSDLKPEEKEDERMFLDGMKCSICGRTCATEWTLYNGSIMHPKCIPRTEPARIHWGVPQITSTQSAPTVNPCNITYIDYNSEERRG